MGKRLLRNSLVSFAVATSTILPIHKALAEFQSGNALYEGCQTKMGDFGSTDCLGYTSGISDALSTNVIDNWKACVPPAATRSQVKDVVTQFLAMHPELRHYAAISLVAQALSEAFPCK